MDQHQVGLRAGVSVTVMSRIRALYYYVYELAEAFGADEDSLSTIEKGVLDRQILKEIEINYLDSLEVVRGRVTISIDWEKHSVFAMTDEGNVFRFESGKSLLEQLSDVSEVVIEHVDALRRAYSIVEVKVSYVFVDDIGSSVEKRQAARGYLGTVPAKKRTTHIEQGFSDTLSVVSENFPEVSITVSTSRPQ